MARVRGKVRVPSWTGRGDRGPGLIVLHLSCWVEQQAAIPFQFWLELAFKGFGVNGSKRAWKPHGENGNLGQDPMVSLQRSSLSQEIGDPQFCKKKTHEDEFSCTWQPNEDIFNALLSSYRGRSWMGHQYFAWPWCIKQPLSMVPPSGVYPEAAFCHDQNHEWRQQLQNLHRHFFSMLCNERHAKINNNLRRQITSPNIIQFFTGGRGRWPASIFLHMG